MVRLTAEKALLVGMQVFKRKGKGKQPMRDPQNGTSAQDAGRQPNDQWKGLRVLSLADLRQRGRTTEDVLAELQRMDSATLAGLDDTAAGSIQQWKPVTQEFPEGLAFVVEPGERIVAYWHFVPLHEAMFARALRGEVEDSEITADKIFGWRASGICDIYVVMVAVLRQYRSLHMLWMLMDAFFQRLEELADNGVYIRNVCAHAFSAAGAATCRLGRMQYLGPHRRCGDIYLLNLPETDWLLSRYPGLKRKYASRFSR
jgi:hypothetical protein